jgi:NAD(P)-dependent dehydrogenase (short-subunit alcohol dehydrogenase family)
MSNTKVWFMTGASRGMDVHFAKAALAAGHAVVASGRDTGRVSQGSSARSSSRTSQRITRSHPSPTTTSAEGLWSSTGKPRMAGNPETPPSRHARFSRLRPGAAAVPFHCRCR